MSTELGPKEQARLAELLGDEYGMRVCRRCRGGEFKFDECWMCRGAGMSRPPIPTGLALIEACRKRGLRFIVDSWPDGGYVIESFIPGSSSRCGIRCEPEDLESAIAIAALKGLEALENTNECKAK